ncbi:MAG: formate/nitrite transporter family protein [Firmicutes bacterium]|nr:formate/nitrite transporter family protein [Bacillota bacterium]
MENMLKPGDIAQATIKSGIKKANLSALKMLLLGIFAGIFIGFGAHADIVATQTLGKTVDVGLAKLIGASVFPVGLMLVVMAGAELFTGNNLMSLAVLDKKITFKGMLRNWIIVYIGNFIGSILLAWILSKSGLYKSDMATKAIAIAKGKVELTFLSAFIRAILCNIVVVLAVWFSTASKFVTGKILAIWFPIMMFVLSGFEHCVANMFFIPMGKFAGANFTWTEMWNNLIPVTIGNIIGGAVLVPIVYYICYIKEDKLKKSKAV